MRMSEHRYDKDRRALDIGARLVGFEVRTTTITSLTGLSAARIRMLFKACGVGAGSRTVRHRGCAPRSTEILLARPSARSEAACLLALCKLMGVDGKAVSGVRADLASSDRLCEVYATFRAMMPTARLTFEQLLLLLTTIARGSTLRAGSCLHCDAVLLVDMLDLAQPICFHCDTAVGTYAPHSKTWELRAADDRGVYCDDRLALETRE